MWRGNDLMRILKTREDFLALNSDERFDALLGAMAHGDSPTSRKKTSTRRSSTQDDGDDCDETQTRQDICPDASR